MIERPCSIRLKSTQKMGPESDETIESYEGSFAQRGDSYYLSYKRNTENGDVKVLIKIEEGSMTLTQKGIIDSKMIFLKGHDTDNNYGTPQGNIVLKVRTKDLDFAMNGNFININLRYDIVFATEPMETAMAISVKLK